METSRIMHVVYQHLPEFLKKKLSYKDHLLSQNLHSQLSIFASMTNIPNHYEEHLIYDTDGCLLFMQTAQSNLSLFNVSCDSLNFDDNEDFHMESRSTTINTSKQYTSSIDIHTQIKQMNHRSTMVLSDEMDSARKTNTLQRWKGVDLLNVYT
ncbi:unnamed protein product [Adineta ricciae]|uniref:Uncharacterized protein n=1 Tax=Adineta ricciae TaxID=249248 RepID=A0A813R1N6_ADIRI|nr:unnamed protein product [Adineta ricciae]CAF0776212.1 unnamed protein product [Adineta ricciae]